MNAYTKVRAALELLYFGSGIVLALFAYFGLKQLKIGLQQIKLTKDIASTNAKREAVKLAADQCRYFAENALRYVGTFSRSTSSGDSSHYW